MIVVVVVAGVFVFNVVLQTCSNGICVVSVCLVWSYLKADDDPSN